MIDEFPSFLVTFSTGRVFVVVKIEEVLSKLRENKLLMNNFFPFLRLTIKTL